MADRFRISETLSLSVGSVLRNEAVVDKIGVAPRHMKGKRGTTRWVPVLPELRRALESWIGNMRRRWILTPDLPLFHSREDNPDGTARWTMNSSFSRKRGIRALVRGR